MILQSIKYMTVQWNLSWQTTATRVHLPWRTISFGQKVLHFSETNLPPKTTCLERPYFLWPMGWSFKTGSTVLIFCYSLRFETVHTTLLFLGSMDWKCRDIWSIASRRSTRSSVCRMFFALDGSSSPASPQSMTENSERERRMWRLFSCWNRKTVAKQCVFLYC